MRSKFLLGLMLSAVFSFTPVFGQPAGRTAASAPRTITVLTEPTATVWVDDILRGTTDESGKLVVKFVPAGTRKVRVRAQGFKEVSMPLLPAKRGDVKVALTKTTDEAELAFQEAEMWTTRDREKAVAAYRKAVSLRPKYAEAHLGLARVLSAMGDYDGALAAVVAARKARPAYAEASAVEGRIYKLEDNEEKAIASFKRAVTEGRGFQAEAHTGLGLLYKDRAEAFAARGDLANADANYALAGSELKKGLAQLSGAPDAKELYQLLGDIYYRAKKYQDAIKTYEEFIRVFPDSPEVTTVRSLIVQTRKEMNGEQ